MSTFTLDTGRVTILLDGFHIGEVERGEDYITPEVHELVSEANKKISKVILIPEDKPNVVLISTEL